MLTREELIEEIVLECTIAKHLYAKLNPADVDYRPSPGQRSTLELLRYLAICASASAYHIATGDMDGARARYTSSANMTFEEFPEAMDRQIDELRAVIGGIPETELVTRTAVHPDGNEYPLGLMFVKMPLKWLTAYRMQLFLYAKANGAADINTANNWVGRDRPRQVAESAAEQSEAAAAQSAERPATADGTEG